MSRRVAMTVHLFASALHRRGVPLLPDVLDLALFVTCGARLPHSAEIGAGTILAHGGNGVVIHPRARIGRNVILHHGHNSLVGANAVVTQSVPARSVVAGVPARVIREDVDAHDVETW